MVDSLYTRIGATKLPLDVSEITGTLSFEVVDPALNVLSSLFTAAIRAELGTGTSSGWYAVTSSLPSTHRLYNSTNPIVTSWKVEPNLPIMRSIKAGWPLLTVWRDGPAEWEPRTTCKTIVRQRWGVMWSVGDYEADLTLKISPVLGYVGKLLGSVINAGRHPAYEADTKQFAEDRGWLSKIVPVSYEAGAARFSEEEDSRFWAASATFESEELVRDLDQGDDSGASSFGLVAGVGDALEILPDLVSGDGDFPGT